MPQLQLPVFAQGMTLINANLGFFVREQSSLTYFYGNLPVFTHDVDDVRSFRMNLLFAGGVSVHRGL